VTIKDIARDAGVSPQTVSRAINDKGEIHPLTRERILRIAERLGYRPNSIARSLATQRTQNVGLVVPDVANPFFAAVARGIQDAAHLARYNIFLCNTDENSERETSAIHSLEAQRVDGIILCSSRLSDRELLRLSDRYQPLVLVNRNVDHPRTRCILVDDFKGTEEATHYIIQLGHRNIGLLAGPKISRSGQERLKGYQRAMRAHDIEPSPSWQVHCPPQVEGGQTAAKQLLRRAPELTALLAYNDLVAVGALRACTELGLNIPGECAIVGCDDVPLAALVSPALTTIHIPTYNLGQQAMSLLLDTIQVDTESGRVETDAGRPIVVAPHLVIRDSAGVAVEPSQLALQRSPL
jgi:LacI family transcriptional regulator